jgi:hypothetical protein
MVQDKSARRPKGMARHALRFVFRTRHCATGSGAHDRSRTGDLTLTKGVLYLLSYMGKRFQVSSARPRPGRGASVILLLPSQSSRLRLPRLERVMGIEPTPSAWKAEVLPLNYTREHREPQPAGQTGPGHHRPSHPEPGHRVVARPQPSGPDGTAQRTLESCWWRGEDSNLRRLSRQIYSLIPLTAREPLRNERRSIRGPAPGRQPTIGARRRTRLLPRAERALALL